MPTDLSMAEAVRKWLCDRYRVYNSHNYGYLILVHISPNVRLRLRSSSVVLYRRANDHILFSYSDPDFFDKLAGIIDKWTE